MADTTTPYFVNSATGEILQAPTNPDPDLYYRVVANTSQAHRAFQEGEKPLIVKPDLLRQGDLDAGTLEQLRYEQYEAPGGIWDHAGAAETPEPLPTSEPGPRTPEPLPASPPGANSPLARPSLAASVPSAVSAAQRPAPTPDQLVRLPAAVAQRIHALVAGQAAPVPGRATSEAAASPPSIAASAPPTS